MKKKKWGSNSPTFLLGGILMEFVINGKERELKFGIGFIRKLDDVYKVDYNGIEFGMGLNMANIQLQQFNPTALVEVIHAAVRGVTSQKQVDEALESYAEENDGLGSLFDLVIEEMGKSAIVKDSLKRAVNLAEQAE